MEIYYGRLGTKYILSDQVEIGEDYAVYTIANYKGLVAKIYRFERFRTLSEREEMEHKLIAMIRMNMKYVIDGTVRFVWPQDIIYENGVMVGFVMPHLQEKTKIYELYRMDTSIDEEDISYIWEYAVRCAYHLSWLISYLHSNGVIVGNFNLDNIRINEKNGNIVISDCEEFVLAESIAEDDMDVFAKESDDISLAVIMFRLFNHKVDPFYGEITEGQRPKHFPVDLWKLFVQAFRFARGTMNEEDSKGVSAAEWCQVLEPYAIGEMNIMCEEHELCVEELPIEEEIHLEEEEPSEEEAQPEEEKANEEEAQPEEEKASGEEAQPEEEEPSEEEAQPEEEKASEEEAQPEEEEPSEEEAQPEEEKASGEENNSSECKKKKGIFIIIVLLLVLGISIYLMTSKTDKQGESKPATMEDENLQEEPEEPVEEEPVIEEPVEEEPVVEEPVVEEPVIEEPVAEEPTEEEPVAQEYIIADSNSRYLTSADLDVLTKDEVLLARNEIFARHGRGFQTSWIQTYFNSKSWYENKYGPREFDRSVRDRVFNEYEKANVYFILDYEKQYGYR